MTTPQPAIRSYLDLAKALGTNCTGSSHLIQPGGPYSSISFNANSVYIY